MINHIHLPIAKPFAAACLIVLGTGLAGTPTAADGGLEELDAGLLADDCAEFIDYKEMDFWFIWQPYHMHDHGQGFEDPAEMEAPWGEWEPKRIIIADGPRHGLKEGWTLEHGEHKECLWTPTWMR